MNTYLIVATTYEGGAPEGDRFAMFEHGVNMRGAFETFVRTWALRYTSGRAQAIETAISSFDIAHAWRERHGVRPHMHDIMYFSDDDGGAYTFTIVRVAAEGERNKHARRALADSLAQAFDA